MTKYLLVNSGFTSPLPAQNLAIDTCTDIAAPGQKLPEKHATRCAIVGHSAPGTERHLGPHLLSGKEETNQLCTQNMQTIRALIPNGLELDDNSL
jgi:hypothetical protein